ncbi:MAG: 50S ribosomal protein L10 [Clostridiaceae bacterium]|jgi:large subunit ribosomal protein L10|nr:50S ribosomal protein L10 [Clostridiaceae bacterium]
MPSVKILEQKKKAVRELRDQLKDAKSMVFADYMGLNVAQDTEMRSEFRKEGLQYRVIKNTITTRVFDELGLEELKPILVGPTAVAYSAEDPILAPRLVAKYRDQYKKFTIKGGVMDGEIISLELIDELSKIPALPVLHGRLVSTMMFPISSLAITLNLLAQKAEEAGVSTVAELATGATAGAEAAAEVAEVEPAAEPEAAPEAEAAPEPETAVEEPAAEAAAAEAAEPVAEAAAEEPKAEVASEAVAEPEAETEEA